MIVEFGKLGGKVQKGNTVSRRTSVDQTRQRIASRPYSCKSKWEKQVRLGYRETKALQTEDNFSPMLAHVQLASKSIVYPAYVQPKLDGVRALVTIDKDGIPVFNSVKQHTVQGALLQQVKELSEYSGFDKFDGELYIHGLSLQKIVALAKKWRTPEQIEAEIEKDYQGDIKRRQQLTTSWKDFDGEVYPVTVEAIKDVDRYSGYSSLDLEYHIFDIPVNANSPWYSESHDKTRLTDLDEVAVAVE